MKIQVLTKSQKKLLKEISLFPAMKNDFFLTGGTALSAFYLQHRYSEDLDFFTPVPLAVKRVIPVINQLVEKLKAKIEIHRSFETFVEMTVTFEEDEKVEIHLAEDTPYRLQPTVYNPFYGIYIDNIIDISSNKFSALFERHEMKDFVDIYFIDKEIMKFEEIYLLAKEKHVGLDDYWLCYALRYINEISILPKMIKPVTIEELRSFFNQKIAMLMFQLEKK